MNGMSMDEAINITSTAKVECPNIGKEWIHNLHQQKFHLNTWTLWWILDPYDFHIENLPSVSYSTHFYLFGWGSGIKLYPEQPGSKATEWSLHEENFIGSIHVWNIYLQLVDFYGKIW